MSSSAFSSLPIKVLIADTDTLTALLLAADLRRREEFEIVECPQDPSALSELLAKEAPDVVLLGSNEQDVVGTVIPLLHNIRGQHMKTRSIVLIRGAARDSTVELMRAGAKGIFDRSDYDSDRLCRCIQVVASGQVSISSEQLGFVLDVFAETAPRPLLSSQGEELLTRREMEVAHIVAEGFSNRDIADQLGLSVHTVKNYLFNIFDKLGVSTRAELMMYVLSKREAEEAQVC